MLSTLMLQILGPYSTDVLALVTIILAILTGFYAIQTKKTVQVLEKTANLEVLPKIKGHLHMVGPMALSFECLILEGDLQVMCKSNLQFSD